MSPVTIHQRKTLSNQKYELQQIDFEKENRHGKPVHHHREVYFRPGAVSVLLVDYSKELLLLTRQFRLPKYLHEGNGDLVEACAGVMDEGETPEQTASREVLEETGYEVRQLRKIGGMYISPAYSMEYLHLFIGEIDIDNKKEEGGGLEAEGEEIEPVTISFRDARELVQNGNVQDIKTMALVQHFLLQHRDA